MHACVLAVIAVMCVQIRSTQTTISCGECVSMSFVVRCDAAEAVISIPTYSLGTNSRNLDVIVLRAKCSILIHNCSAFWSGHRAVQLGLVLPHNCPSVNFKCE